MGKNHDDNKPIISLARLWQYIIMGVPYYGYVREDENCKRYVEFDISKSVFKIGELEYDIIADKFNIDANKPIEVNNVGIQDNTKIEQDKRIIDFQWWIKMEKARIEEKKQIDEEIYRRAQGEIKQYEPNWFGKMEESWFGRTWVGKVSLGIIDDAWITFQCFTIGHPNAYHINGSSTYGQETVDAGLNTLTTFLPTGRLWNGMKGSKVLSHREFYNKFLREYKDIQTLKRGTVNRSWIRYNTKVTDYYDFKKIWFWFGYLSTSTSYIMEDEK